MGKPVYDKVKAAAAGGTAVTVLYVGVHALHGHGPHDPLAWVGGAAAAAAAAGYSKRERTGHSVTNVNKGGKI